MNARTLPSPTRRTPGCIGRNITRWIPSPAVPNGKYIANLHFAETYEGITGEGQRVFSYNVQGHEFKDFDVWKKAGAKLRLR